MKTTTAMVIVGIAAVALVYYAAKQDTYPRPAPLQTDSGITGTVLLGPTCPVMQDPPARICDDAPYVTTVDVLKTDIEQGLIASVQTDAHGTFRIPLEPGFYVVSPRGGSVFPYCKTQNVEIRAHVFETMNLFCDTGIR